MIANPTYLIWMTPVTQRWVQWPILFLITILCVACKPSPEEQTPQPTEPPPAAPSHTINLSDAEADTIAIKLWAKGLQEFSILLEHAEQLQTKIERFLDEPEDKSLITAQEQWQLTFVQYQKVQPFLFVDNITTSVNSGVIKKLSELRFALAAWPLQPGYLDSYGPYVQSGIVNDISLRINSSTLRKQNGQTDPEEVTLGLHAMQFLLWGDKQKPSAERFQIQEKIPLALERSGLKKDELPNNRRRQLLKLQNQLFVSDVKTLIQQWQNNGPLSIAFQQLTPTEKLLSISSSIESSTKQLQKLLLYIDEENNDQGNSKGTENPTTNFYFDQFDQNRKKAIAETLSATRSLYFDDQNQGLGFIIFSKEQQEQLDNLFEKIKSQLGEKKGVYNIFVSNSLNEIISLTSTIDNTKE